MTIADAGDGGGLPAEGRDDVGKRHVELGDGERQRCLEAEHPRGSLIERNLLGVRSVRGVIGRDRVDRAIGKPGLERVDVGASAQWWVHLEHRVVAAELLVGEGEVVRRRFGGDRQALRLRLPYELHAARGAEVEEVHRDTGEADELDVAEHHQFLGDRRPSR